MKTTTTPQIPAQVNQQPTSSSEQVRESIQTDTSLKSPKNALEIDSVPNEKMGTGAEDPAGTGADNPGTNQVRAGADTAHSKVGTNRRKTATKAGTATNRPATDSNQNREQATDTNKHTATDKSGTDGSGAELTKSGASANQVRRRGERGADKVPRKKRTDSSISAFEPDDRVRILKHNMNVMSLGKMENKDDLDEVLRRLHFYYDSCIEHAVMPTVAGMALALGIDRRTLWTWLDEKSKVIKNPDVLDTLKNVYSQITCQYEDLMTQGKIIPVAGIFLMKNNMGYKDTTDHIVTVGQEQEPDTGEIAARAGLLEDSQD